MSEKNIFEGLNCPSESALFRRNDLGQLSDARIIALLLKFLQLSLPLCYGEDFYNQSPKLWSEAWSHEANSAKC